jgi:prolipoprotein diacylglyceryltransferase
MLPVLNVGPLAIQFPGLVLIAGLWLGLSLAERYASRRGVQASALYNLVFVALIAGVIGARLAYVARYPEAFRGNPLSLVSLNPGLLDIWGGLAVGVIAALVYGQRKGLALWTTLDALTPALAALAIALHLSHLASGAAFGAPTDLPWGIELWGARRHPAQIYATLGASLILAYLWPSRKRAWVPGVYFLTFLALSAAARLFLEAFRGDSALLPNGFRAAQVIAWLALAASLWAIQRLGRVETSAEAPDPGQ